MTWSGWKKRGTGRTRYELLDILAEKAARIPEMGPDDTRGG